jgi:hypothetical protein
MTLNLKKKLQKKKLKKILRKKMVIFLKKMSPRLQQKKQGMTSKSLKF